MSPCVVVHTIPYHSVCQRPLLALQRQVFSCRCIFQSINRSMLTLSLRPGAAVLPSSITFHHAHLAIHNAGTIGFVPH